MAKKIIPRIIHTCWFGDAPKPPKILMCLESWKKHLSNYEIMEWNENNFDLSQFPFAQEAFKRKRYAFVTDVVRLWALKTYGGVYMDGDVLVLKSFDRFLSHRAFTGHETSELTVTATMGAEKNHPWINRLLSYYDNRSYSETTNTQIITNMNKPLIERKSHGFTYLRDGVVIYPVHTFANFDHKKLVPIPHPEAYAHHLYAGSWLGRS